MVIITTVLYTVHEEVSSTELGPARFGGKRQSRDTATTDRNGPGLQKTTGKQACKRERQREWNKSNNHLRLSQVNLDIFKCTYVLDQVTDQNRTEQQRQSIKGDNLLRRLDLYKCTYALDPIHAYSMSVTHWPVRLKIVPCENGMKRRPAGQLSPACIGKCNRCS